VRALAALIAAFALGACANPRDPNADEASCAVYRSFYETAHTGAGGYQEIILVGDTTDEIILSDGGNAAAPLVFETDENLFVGTDMPRPTITEDTSAYFDQVQTKNRKSLRNCFDADAPRLVGPDNYQQFARMGEFDEPGAAVYRLSPVAFAADDKHALLVADWTCAPNVPCGGSGYFLFVRRGDAWALIGYQAIGVA
jgi:hypothetical protein